MLWSTVQTSRRPETTVPHASFQHPAIEAGALHRIPLRVLADESGAEEGHPVPYIDGALEPDRIPDQVAYGLFFNTLSQWDSADPALEHYARRVLDLGSLGAVTAAPDLTPAEFRNILITVAHAYSAQLRELRGSPGFHAGLRDSASMASVAELERKLDTVGVIAVRSFVRNHVKRNIRVFQQ